MAEERELRRITQEELDAILVEHEKWLDSGGKEGARADLSYTDLSAKSLPDAFKTHKRLTQADLSFAHMEAADLSFAHMEGAILFDAHMEGADLCGADMEGANLCGAHMEGADIVVADLRNTDLTGVHTDRKIKCRALRLDGCYGSPQVERFLRDQDYLEELRVGRIGFKKWAKQLISPTNWRSRSWRSQMWGKAVYWVWLISADCGRSLWPWVLWSIGIMLGYAGIFYSLGEKSFRMHPPVDVATDMYWSFSACLYYSVVTFSTLGFGDVTPKTFTASYWVMAEVITGYVMLGGLISIFANKLARRS